jgi:hypothetical protein
MQTLLVHCAASALEVEKGDITIEIAIEIGMEIGMIASRRVLHFTP